MPVFLSLLIALLLDRLFGEPEWLWSRVPHPITLIGRAIDAVDTALNRPPGRMIKGGLAIAGLCAAGLLGALVIQWLPTGGLLDIAIAAVLIAHKSLLDHVGAVGAALQRSLPEARASVAMIVGRDTSEMVETDIARAAIESAAENFSDGVIAPAFWFLVAGLPGLVVYKIVNTADSMIGYKTERYHAFGFAAAKLDDVLNWAPARLSALLIVVAHRNRDAWQIVQRDADLHRSPNAGWPEAAVAGVLNIALAGPRRYHGEVVDYPFVNPSGKASLDSYDIDNVIAVLNRSWMVLVALLALASLLWIVF